VKTSETPSIHRRLTLALQALVLTSFLISLYELQWQNAATVAAIFLVTLLPQLFSRQFEIHIPAEFELLTIAFVFAALFLGETRDYYGRFWWWDIALHATSGGLLGILGVLLIYVLNEDPRVDIHLRPGFVAFFAFCFAMAVGAVWEIFEFFMDQTFGMNMQKPMFDDDSGLTDTMWDLIVDSIGAGIMSISAYIFMKRRKTSFVEEWIQNFILANPRLFARKPPALQKKQDLSDREK